MSAREWRPGDVALVTYFDPPQRAIVRHWRHDANQRLEFAYDGGGYDMVSDAHVEKTARPLVVIDPEDREQVERLLGRFYGLQKVAAVEINDFQAALREFANPHPPKPDEPTGLGAVVEDAEGDFWVYVGNRTALSDTRIWQHARKELVFDEIAAVKVLSKGVQS